MPFTPLVSIIIVDYKKQNPYLIECLDAIGKQTYKNFEIILVADYEIKLDYPKLRTKFYGHYVGPAEKRDEGAKMSKGEILAFIDDDAFPSSTWLQSIVPHFKNTTIAGVGGPGVTPPEVSWQEEASGWASASPLGSGPYTYRFLPGRKQFVEDFPSMNLSVRKTDFEKVGGYDSNFWPGEDTKLCLDLTHKLHKKIVYEPKAKVFHHRRPIMKSHLRQNGNFGLHRGFFARILPETSFKPVYFLPSLFLLGFVYLMMSYSYLVIARNLSDAAISLHQVQIIGLYSLAVYFFVLFLNSIWIFAKSNSIFQAFISIPVIFVTHLWYGVRFIQGFLFTDKLIR